MALALTELCGPQLKMASKGMVQCQPCQRFDHTHTPKQQLRTSVCCFWRDIFGVITPLQGGCLDAAVAKRAERKFNEKGGVTTVVPPRKRLHLGASREQKIDFVGTKSSGGVVSAWRLPQQPKNVPLTRLGVSTEGSFCDQPSFEGLAAADWKSAGQSRLPGKGSRVLSANCAQHFSATLD